MSEVRVIEMLSECSEQGPHVWIDIHMNDQILTVRIDPINFGGFKVFMKVDDSCGTDTIVT